MLVSFDEPPNAVKVRVGGVAHQRCLLGQNSSLLFRFLSAYGLMDGNRSCVLASGRLRSRDALAVRAV